MIRLQIQTFGWLQCALGFYTLVLNRDLGLNLSTHKYQTSSQMPLDTSGISVGLADTSVGEQNHSVNSLDYAGFPLVSPRQRAPL